jgi:hypothetical protein
MASKCPHSDQGITVPLTIAVGRAGHAWEASLLAASTEVHPAETLVDLLVLAELRAPDLIVVPEDFPRLVEGLTQLRRLGRVLVVGHTAWADCPPEEVTLQRLRRLVVPDPGDRGKLVTVWGPPGSWGVTSVAVGVARSLTMRGSALLIDANVHAPSVDEVLSLPLGGLLQACLAADRGAVELPVRSQGPLSVLTGVEPAMYPSVHPAALHMVLEQARREHAWVVADTDAAVDSAGEIGLVPDWTTTTTIAMQEAEHLVIVVGESDAALTRLWRALPAVAEILNGRATVVVNRCRNPRRVTSQLAARLGDYLPEAAVGWVSDRITAKTLAPIVAEVCREVARR